MSRPSVNTTTCGGAYRKLLHVVVPIAGPDRCGLGTASRLGYVARIVAARVTIAHDANSLSCRRVSCRVRTRDDSISAGAGGIYAKSWIPRPSNEKSSVCADGHCLNPARARSSDDYDIGNTAERDPPYASIGGTRRLLCIQCARPSPLRVDRAAQGRWHQQTPVPPRPPRRPGNTDPTRRAPTGTLGRSFDDAVGMIRGGAIARHRHDRRLRRHLQRSDGLPDLPDLRQRARFRCYPANRRFARHRQVNPGDAHCRDCNAIMFYRSRNSDGVQRWPGSPCTTWTKG